MPPKKLKDLSSAPVYSAPHEEQVRLLSDALLREFMHRRGFLATLKTFDEENPRDADTVSSRAVMSDLMAVPPAEAKRLKEEGIETIMEMLCDLRVERRQTAEALQAQAEAPLPEVPEELLELHRREVKRQQKREKLREQRGSKGGADGSFDDGDGGDDAAFSHRRASKKDKKTKKDKKKRASSSSGGGGGDSAAAGTSRSTALLEDLGGLTIDDLLGSSGSSSVPHSNTTETEHPGRGGGMGSGGGGVGADADKPGGKRFSGDGAGSASGGHGTDGGAPAAIATSSSSSAAKTAAMNPVGAAWVKSKEAEEAVNKKHSDDDDDAGAATDEVEPRPIGTTPLSEEAAQAACSVLCGRNPIPPVSFLQQGFCFDELPDCSLIQWLRGPGAAIAAIQAFIFGFYYEKEVYTDNETRRRDCLARALLASLRAAQPNAAHVVLVQGRFVPRGSKADPTRRFHSGLANSFYCYDRLASAEEVEEKLQAVLDQWMEPRGCGLWCFLLSLVLSRGCAAVRLDSERLATSGALIDGRGDGTMELANLCLCGRAVGGCANASPEHPKGYQFRLTCGMLDGERPIADAGEEAQVRRFGYATEPQLASWVVAYKGHFRNLFQRRDTRKVFQQKRALGGTVTADLSYWDSLTEDDVYDLTVAVTGIGSGTAGSSFVNAAIRSIPLWATGTVDWKGESPVRD